MAMRVKHGVKPIKRPPGTTRDGSRPQPPKAVALRASLEATRAVPDHQKSGRRLTGKTVAFSHILLPYCNMDFIAVPSRSSHLYGNPLLFPVGLAAQPIFSRSRRGDLDEFRCRRRLPTPTRYCEAIRVVIGNEKLTLGGSMKLTQSTEWFRHEGGPMCSR